MLIPVLEEMKEIISKLQKSKEELLNHHYDLLQYKENQLIQVKESMKDKYSDKDIQVTLKRYEESLNIVVQASESNLSFLETRIYETAQDLLLLKLKIINLSISKTVEDVQTFKKNMEDAIKTYSDANQQN